MSAYAFLCTGLSGTLSSQIKYKNIQIMCMRGTKTITSGHKIKDIRDQLMPVVNPKQELLVSAWLDFPPPARCQIYVCCSFPRWVARGCVLILGCSAALSPQELSIVQGPLLPPHRLLTSTNEMLLVMVLQAHTEKWSQWFHFPNKLGLSVSEVQWGNTWATQTVTKVPCYKKTYAALSILS